MRFQAFFRYMRKRNTSTSDFNNNRFPWGKMTPGIFQFQEFFSAYHCSGSLRDPSSHRSAPIWPSYNRCDTAECYKAVTRDTAICTQFPLEGTWHRKERSEQSFIVLSFSRKKGTGWHAQRLCGFAMGVVGLNSNTRSAFQQDKSIRFSGANLKILEIKEEHSTSHALRRLRDVPPMKPTR